MDNNLHIFYNTVYLSILIVCILAVTLVNAYFTYKLYDKSHKHESIFHICHHKSTYGKNAAELQVCSAKCWSGFRVLGENKRAFITYPLTPLYHITENSMCKEIQI